MAKTILKKARVFAINEHFYRRDDEEGGVLQARTVSLQVTPRQVEVLTLAQKLGDLSLAFRSPGDEDEDTDLRAGGTSVADLMRPADKVKDIDPNAALTSPGNNVADFVRDVGLPQMRMAAQPEPVSTEPAFRTQIIDQNGSRWYEYGPQGNMPREVIPGAEDRGQADGGENELEEPTEDMFDTGRKVYTDESDFYVDPPFSTPDS
jgi:hypothetical protein